MQTQYQESKSLTEAKLIANLGMACRLALMPDLMKCPTVRQRAAELELYLSRNRCTETFRMDFIEFTGQLNDMSSMHINCFNKVRIYRLAKPVAAEIITCNRVDIWKHRQLIAAEMAHG